MYSTSAVRPCRRTAATALRPAPGPVRGARRRLNLCTAHVTGMHCMPQWHHYCHCSPTLTPCRFLIFPIAELATAVLVWAIMTDDKAKTA